GTPSRAKVAGAPPQGTKTIEFAFERVHKLTGVAMKEQQIRATLAALGFTVGPGSKASKVSTPSWRPDINGPADLIEEVVRVYGLDRVPSVPLPLLHGVARPVLTGVQLRARRARRALAARGFTEAITWSFLPRATAEAFGGGQDTLELANPISSEMTSMRPSLLPGLLAGVKRNRNRGTQDIALFEVGQSYLSADPPGHF